MAKKRAGRGKAQSGATPQCVTRPTPPHGWRPRPPHEGRPSWDDYFLSIAAVVATRSTCLRRSVGALLVLDKQILATGYNGAPSGLPHCSEVGCMRQELAVPSGQRHELCRGLHGEMNALLQAAKHGISINGATLYCTTSPCSLCAKMLINGGIKRIVAVGEYPDTLAREMLQQAGIELELRGSLPLPPLAGASKPRPTAETAGDTEG